MDSAAGLDYPEQILAYKDGFLVAKTMFAACELGVFDVLLESVVPLSSEAIAQRLDASADGVSRLLDACVGLKLLEVENSKAEVLYKNTEMSAIYLTQSSPKSLLPMLAYHSNTKYGHWAYLKYAVREGKNQNERALGTSSRGIFETLYRTEDEMLNFMSYMDSSWIVWGSKVITAFDLSSFPNVCDIGGCTGALAKRCILANPLSRVTIYDMPKVVEMAKRHFISPEEDQIRFIEGDFFKDPIPEVDLYMLARIIHAWTEDKCLQLLTKIFNSCKPGGGLLLVEALLNEDKRGCLETQLSSLNMLIHAEGKERTASEYTGLLTKAGFRNVEIRITGQFFNAILARK